MIVCGRIKCQKKLTKETFIINAQKVHGNLFDYSLVNYINNRTKIKILCRKHGEFEQTPVNHMNYGCKKCGSTYPINYQNFIDRANKVHNSFYLYDNVSFKSTKDKCTIKCPIHGKFEQEVHSHLQGIGCYQCGKEKRKGKYNFTLAERHKEKYKETKAFIYLLEISIEKEAVLKIGITTNIKRRIWKIPYEVKILKTLEMNLYDAVFLEDKILKTHNKKELKISFGGYKECFDLELKEKLLKEFK